MSRKGGQHWPGGGAGTELESSASQRARSSSGASSCELSSTVGKVRQCFGYERHDNPEVVALINTLIEKAYGPLRNFFHASLKLERKERTPGVPGRLKRVYGTAQTPLARVLASAEASEMFRGEGMRAASRCHQVEQSMAHTERNPPLCRPT
jgi:hypothetical protein